MANSAAQFADLPRGWPRRVRSAVIHTISLARTSAPHTRSWAANHYNARIRLKAESERLRGEILHLREEMRIKDARMEQIVPHRRPHYPPVERLAILELRAARGWSQAQTAARFLVSALTVSHWNQRLDEEGADALVQVPVPVSKYPEFVGYAVRRLKALFPEMGKRRIANILCRAGLHLGATTVRRMLREAEKPKPIKAPSKSAAGRVVTARRPNHVWHTDLSTVPTALGFWVPWFPCAIPPIWPFCWFVGVVEDHFSRRIMGVATFKKEPTSKAIRAFLDRVIRSAGRAPNHLISDKGTQFTESGFPSWCRRHGIRHRFGAVGKYGSIAIIERLMRTLKRECTRRLVFVPFRRAKFERELTLWSRWYNSERPHESLISRTPDEVYYYRRPACRAPRYEPRARWPRRSRCAGPHALVRGRPGVRVEIDVGYASGRRHLPVISVRKAA
jgi:putative transposase